MDYLIEEFKCGCNGDFNEGPAERCNIVTMKFNDGKTTKWLSNYEVFDNPNFYLTDEDIFDDLVNEDSNDDEYDNKASERKFLWNKPIKEFHGVDLNGYEEMYVSLANNNSPEAKLIKALFIVTRCNIIDLEPVINLIVNTTVNENKVLNASLAELFNLEQ